MGGGIAGKDLAGRGNLVMALGVVAVVIGIAAGKTIMMVGVIAIIGVVVVAVPVVEAPAAVPTPVRTPSEVEVPVRIPHPVAAAQVAVEAVDAGGVFEVIVAGIVLSDDGVRLGSHLLSGKLDDGGRSLGQIGAVGIGFHANNLAVLLRVIIARIALIRCLSPCLSGHKQR